MYTQIQLFVYLFIFTSEMFKLNENYEIIGNILKCDYTRYSPSEISTINTAYFKYILINLERILLFLC